MRVHSYLAVEARFRTACEATPGKSELAGKLGSAQRASAPGKSYH